MAIHFETKKGIDWDALRADYAKRCSPEELALQPKSATDPVRVPRKAAAPSQPAVRTPAAPSTGPKKPRKGTTRVAVNKTPEAVVDSIVQMYVEKDMQPNDIAKEVHLRTATVRSLLQGRNVYDRRKSKFGRAAHKDYVFYSDEEQERLILTRLYVDGQVWVERRLIFVSGVHLNLVGKVLHRLLDLGQADTQRDPASRRRVMWQITQKGIDRLDSKE